MIKINKTFYKLIFSVLNGAPLNVVKQNVLIILSMQDLKKNICWFCQQERWYCTVQHLNNWKVFLGKNPNKFSYMKKLQNATKILKLLPKKTLENFPFLFSLFIWLQPNVLKKSLYFYLIGPRTVWTRYQFELSNISVVVFGSLPLPTFPKRPGL